VKKKLTKEMTPAAAKAKTNGPVLLIQATVNIPFMKKS
jgi:hypothetical protein